jgi:hypothetical protein
MTCGFLSSVRTLLTYDSIALTPKLLSWARFIYGRFSGDHLRRVLGVHRGTPRSRSSFLSLYSPTQKLVAFDGLRMAISAVRQVLWKRSVMWFDESPQIYLGRNGSKLSKKLASMDACWGNTTKSSFVELTARIGSSSYFTIHKKS